MKPELILLAASLVIWGIGEGMFFFFQPLYLQELGADPVTIGSILGMVGLAMTLVHIPAGYLADRVGRRPLLWTAWIFGTLAVWIMALSDSILGFVTGATLYGLTAFVASPMSSYVTAARGNLPVGRALTLASATYNLGSVIGPTLGGWIGQTIGFQRIFCYSGVLFAISTILILFLPKQALEPSVDKNPIIGFRSLSNRKFLSLTLFFFISFLVMYLPQPLSQNYLQNVKELNLMQIGNLLSIRSIGIVVLNLTLGRLNPMLGLLSCQAFMATSSIFIWQGRGIIAYRVAYFMFGSYQTARLFANAQARNLIESRIMGLTYGVIETVLASAIILAPPLAGIIYRLSPDFIYPVSAALISLTILINLYRIRIEKHRAQ
jgi:MFS family permease